MTLGKRSLVVAIVLGMNSAGFLQAEEEGPEKPRKTIVVSIPHRKLALLEDGQVIKIYDTAVGAAESPSPVGEFAVATRVTNPAHYRRGRVTPPGKANPLGTRWIGLTVKGYGIHGTNVPRSIGEAASHGCIRMRNRDVEELFRMVAIGDKVDLRGQVDDELVSLFGALEPPPAVRPLPQEKEQASPAVLLALSAAAR
jgi:lipoprotein-anchoring transpeptidase ErfK/SrfK